MLVCRCSRASSTDCDGLCRSRQCSGHVRRQQAHLCGVHRDRQEGHAGCCPESHSCCAGAWGQGCLICDDANLAEVTCVPTFDMHAHVCTCIHLFVPSSIWALFRQSFVHVLICAFLLCCVFIFGVSNLSRPSHALQCRLLNQKALVHTVHWQKLHCITHFGCDTYRKVLQTDELNH